MRHASNDILIVALALVMVPVASAQTPAPLCCATVTGLEVAFAGFEAQDRPILGIAVDLQSHGACQPGDALIVRIRDGCIPPPNNPTAPEATWVYSGQSSKAVRVILRLPVPLHYRGPLYVDVLMQKPERYACMFGRMMLPVKGADLTPYGTVDLDRNCLHLRAEFESRTVYPPPIRFDIEGARIGAPSVIAFSPLRTEVEFTMGGCLLIGPSPIVPLPKVLHADELGRVTATLALPYDPRLEGIVFYAQAASDSMDDSLQPWLFSNGVRIELRKP